MQSVAQPKLYYKAGALSKLVVEQCTALTSNYYPAPLAFSGNAQTITTGASIQALDDVSDHLDGLLACAPPTAQSVGVLKLPHTCNWHSTAQACAVRDASYARLAVLRQLTMWGRFTRELRAMHDGGCVALDWYRNHQSRACFSPHTPIVLILHGLSGAFTCFCSCA